MRMMALMMLMMIADCTPAQQQADLPYLQALSNACGVAMSLSPLAGPVAPWIIGGCATADAVAKLAQDPSSLAWVNGLIAKARGGA